MIIIKIESKKITDEQREKKNKKVNMIITNIVRLLLILIILRGVVVRDYSQLFIAILTIAMTFYPSLLEKKFGVYLPGSMQIVITLFIFGAQYLR